MHIEFDHELSDADAQTLADVLNCEVDDLDEHFSGFAQAAADEYVQMLLGKNAFKRANDFLEFRIYLLVGYVLNGRLPDEAMVSRYFQLSSTEARARLKSVTSKYQRGLERQIKHSVRDILEDADHDEENASHCIAVNNQTIIDLLNSTLASVDGNLSPVSKVRGTVARYEMPQASYDVLWARFGT